MRLAPWEIDELEEHFESRPDLYTHLEQNIWLRRDGEELAFALGLARDTGEVELEPFAWSKEETECYVQRTCKDWTSYGDRLRLEALFLEDRDNPLTPHGMALEAVKILRGIEPSPEVDSGHGTVYKTGPNTVTYRLEEGGWLTVSYSEPLRVRMSLPLRGEHSGGYALPLEGHVRPTSGASLQTTAALLFGWRTDYDSSEPEQAPTLPGLSEEVLLEVRGEPGAVETGVEAGDRESSPPRTGVNPLGEYYRLSSGQLDLFTENGDDRQDDAGGAERAGEGGGDRQDPSS